KLFYKQALAPLDYKVIMDLPGTCGLGAHGKPDFWLKVEPQVVPTHVAFVASARKIVDHFYQAALEAGGRDNGKPGFRHEYHNHYYGAFILDPDGHNIEAVTHLPE